MGRNEAQDSRIPSANEQKQTEVLLTDARLFAESIVDTLREPLLILGPDLRIIRANRSFYSIFKATPEKTEGFLLFEINNGQWNVPMLHRLFGEVQKNHTSFENFEMEHNFNLTGKRSMLLNARPIFSGAGENQLILLAMEDVTDRKHVEEMLRELSLTDDLTHLYNRRGFLTLAADRLKLARRAKTGLWLFFADVDGLKHINDTFGHPEGDRALVKVAQVLKRCFRESDVMARLSGDEFVVLITTAAATNDCEEAVLSRVGKSLNDLNSHGARNYNLSLSMGACHFGGADQWSVDSMMVKADEKMYELKKIRQSQQPEKQAKAYSGDYSDSAFPR
jgi:diguanylate cyclase (GGDEF)-like protein